jgi:hypothetical protein
MLEEVTIELKQVQEKISEILPDDAILCGQSLNNDLHSLKVNLNKLFILLSILAIIVY